jgi:hypothetical protein
MVLVGFLILAETCLYHERTNPLFYNQQIVWQRLLYRHLYRKSRRIGLLFLETNTASFCNPPQEGFGNFLWTFALFVPHTFYLIQVVMTFDKADFLAFSFVNDYPRGEFA